MEKARQGKGRKEKERKRREGKGKESKMNPKGGRRGSGGGGGLPDLKGRTALEYTPKSSQSVFGVW